MRVHLQKKQKKVIYKLSELVQTQLVNEEDRQAEIVQKTEKMYAQIQEK